MPISTIPTLPELGPWLTRFLGALAALLLILVAVIFR